MIPFRTILLPTDFSDRSEAALRVACSLARDHGARLIHLHVAPMATVFGGTFPGVPADPAIYRHALEKQLSQIRIPEPEVEVAPRLGGPGIVAEQLSQNGGVCGPELLVEHRLSEGDAATEILAVADEVGADLIVLGTHGRTGLDRVMMGSVAEAVLRGARIPVLTLKSPLPEAEAESNRTGPETSAP